MSGFAVGFPRTLGFLFDSPVSLRGMGWERSSLPLLPVASGVKWQGMCLVPARCLAQGDPRLASDL